MEEKNNIVIYQLEDGKTKIDVKLEDEELDRNSTCQNFRQIRKEVIRLMLYKYVAIQNLVVLKN